MSKEFLQSIHPISDDTRLNYDMGQPSKNLDNLKDVLLDVVTRLSLAKDLETIMFIVRKAARKLADADGASFVLMDNDQCYYADEDAIAPLWKGKRFPMSICVSGWAMQHCETVIIPDIYDDPRVPIEAYRPTFVKSLAMFPIRKEAPIGAIGTYWAEHFIPTVEQLNLLQALAESTSVAMENVQLQKKLAQGAQEASAQIDISRALMETNRSLESSLCELNRRNEEMQLLSELSATLQTCMHLQETYKLITQYTTQLLPDIAGILYLMHPSRNYLESATSWGEPVLEEKIIKPQECLALRRGAIYQVDNPEEDLVCTHYKANSNTHPYICIPLFAQSDIIGLFYLEWKHFNSDAAIQTNKKNHQYILANMLAEQIALGISNIQLRETLRNQSLRDSLTGLYNRRYLEETLEREMRLCARQNTSLAALMIDIDHFKQFNDQFGHDAGDIVIQALAGVLRDFARKNDIVCRYGGEEFIIVMPEIELDMALKRTLALHNAIHELHLRYVGQTLPPITVSIGLALYPVHGENMHDLIAAADIALYQAKTSGRNKTIVYKGLKPS